LAVVQISKIQIRRGQKNSSSGVPQLSSAELAWAVDTQELFIGNGSVQEGAPYVGNTKIITEHDNILELANSYRFSSDDPSIVLSQPRTLLGKVDEIEVSVIDYGAVPDGSTSANAAFSNAFTELFRNSNDDYKKVLKVPNGEYLFTSDLEIPSNVIIRGETQSGAKLNLDTRNIRFITANGTGLINFTSGDRPENVMIENLTILRSSGQTVITGLKNSTFEKVKWKGEYVLSTPSSSINLSTGDSAVFWNNSVAGIKVDSIKFKGCVFESNAIGVKCSQTISTNTTVNFQDCEFFINDTSVNVIGVAGQKNDWQFNNCEFNEISRYVFNSNYGAGTKFIGSSFINCGNSTNTSANPIWPMISFGEPTDNIVVNCFSNRQQNAGVVTSETITGVSEVLNSDYTQLLNRNYSDIFLSNSFRPVAVFSALNNFITVNYILRLGVHVRYGKIVLTVGDGLQKISFTDKYQYSDSSTTSEGGKIMSNFQFDVELRDNDADSGIETVVLYYKNPLSTGATGNISFDVSYGA
jgi:predicted secreted protein